MTMDAPEPLFDAPRRRPGPFAASVAVLLLLMLALAAPVPAQETDQPAQDEAPAEEQPPAEPGGSARDGRRIQDWTLRCRQPDTDGPEVCEMFQRHVDDRGNVVLHAIIGNLPNNPNPGFLIILPLGISLPPGTFVQIDDGEEVLVPVERCVAQGCRLELLIDDQLMGLLKAGREATVTFHAYDRQGEVQRVRVPISLMGFTSALNEVMQ